MGVGLAPAADRPGKWIVVVKWVDYYHDYEYDYDHDYNDHDEMIGPENGSLSSSVWMMIIVMILMMMIIVIMIMMRV